LLTMVTSGADLDPNGYMVALDDGVPTAVPANGSVTLDSVSPGAHTLSFADVDENCALQEEAPVSFSVTEGAQTSVTMHVTCTFANTLAYIQDDTLYITSAEPGAAPRRIGQGYAWLRWSADGSTLALFTYDEVYLADADGGNVRLLHEFGGFTYPYVTGAVWSPDGTSLLLDLTTIRQAHSVVRLSTSGGDPEPFAGGFNAAWSPDGRHVLVSTGANAPPTLNLFSAEGVLERVLGPGYEAAWSPDGSRIAYLDYDFDTKASSLHTMGPDGSDKRDLTGVSSAVVELHQPRWSPDGRELSFLVATWSDGTTSGPTLATLELWVMPAEGGDRRQLTPLSLSFRDQGAWSRDGAGLAFGALSGQLALIQRDGSGLTPVSPLGGNVTSWGWRP